MQIANLIVRGALWFATTLAITSLASADIGRPSPDQGPTKVDIKVFIFDVDDVDYASQNFEANVFYQVSWHDPRLAHEDPNSQIAERFSLPDWSIDAWTVESRPIQIVPDERMTAAAVFRSKRRVELATSSVKLSFRWSSSWRCLGSYFGSIRERPEARSVWRLPPC